MREDNTFNGIIEFGMVRRAAPKSCGAFATAAARNAPCLTRAPETIFIVIFTNAPVQDFPFQSICSLLLPSARGIQAAALLVAFTSVHRQLPCSQAKLNSPMSIRLPLKPEAITT